MNRRFVVFLPVRRGFVVPSGFHFIHAGTACAAGYEPSQRTAKGREDDGELGIGACTSRQVKDPF
jgi:hypothetical protein